jgi:hypothetical protein
VALSTFISQPSINQARRVSHDQIIYLAQSGVNWAAAVWNATNGSSGTADDFNATLSNTDYAPPMGSVDLQRIPGPNNNTSQIWVRSHANLAGNSYWLVKYIGSLTGNGTGPSEVPGLGFDETGDNTLDDYWDDIRGDAEYSDAGPTDGGAVRFQGEIGLLGLDWYGNDAIDLDLAQMREESSNLLSYYLQLKLKVETQGQKGSFYMLGLNFRMQADSSEITGISKSYGLSIFKYTPDAKGKDIPEWANRLDGFEPVQKDGIPCLVLWKKLSSAGNFILVDYAPLLTNEYNLLINKELIAWPTMLLDLKERNKTEGQGTENVISAYLQIPPQIEKGTREWDLSKYNIVEWVLSGQDRVIDDSLDSSGVINGNNEIGEHTYFDAPAQNDQFLADFGMAL